MGAGQKATGAEREVRRSFLLGVSNGVLFNFAERLIDPPLVLTLFVNGLTSSKLLAGLVAPLGNAGWFLPQMFISARVQRMERKMPSYVLAAVVRVVCWLLLAATVWLVDDPALLLIGFFALYALARLASGLAGLAFFDVVGKTIPVRRRGAFFAWRQFLGGILGLGAGWIVKTLLNRPSFAPPHDYALLFVFYCAAAIPALAAFIIIREPVGTTVAEPVGLVEQLRRAGRILRRDAVYSRYIAIRLSLGLAGVALPFYAIYASDVLGASAGMVGVYVAARVGGQLLFNLPWGRVSDRRGNRVVMRLLCSGNGLSALLALALVGFVELVRPEGTWLPYLALPIFFLNGAILPANVLVGSNFVLELVSEAERPLYMGFSNTLMGFVVLISGLGGLVVDLFGFVALFALSLGLCIVGFVLARRLPEPRRPGGQEGSDVVTSSGSKFMRGGLG